MSTLVTLMSTHLNYFTQPLKKWSCESCVLDCECCGGGGSGSCSGRHCVLPLERGEPSERLLNFLLLWIGLEDRVLLPRADPLVDLLPEFPR